MNNNVKHNPMVKKDLIVKSQDIRIGGKLYPPQLQLKAKEYLQQYSNSNLEYQLEGTYKSRIKIIAELPFFLTMRSFALF